MITLIAACSLNKVIGKNNTLIWKVPGDLKRFKELTSGHTVLMGRKTYESIGRPLPNRRNIILTRNPEFKAEGCLIYSDLKEVLDLYKNDLFVIGGEEIYKQTLGYADYVELTLINKEFEGDAFFPNVPDWFVEQKREDLNCEEFDFSYITYQHIKHYNKEQNERLSKIDPSIFPEELFDEE
jgi:dihydrofolate reductase